MVALVAVVAPGVGGGCATTEGDLKRLKKEVRGLTVRRKASQRALQRLERYEGRLKAGSGGLGDVILVGKEALAGLAKASMPVTFKGKDLHPKLRGNFKLSRPYDLRIKKGGQVALRMVLTGTKVRVAIDGYASHKKKIKAALGAGVILDVTAHLTVNKKTNSLFIYLRCDAAHLKKHDESIYRDNIRKAMNSKVFRNRGGVRLPARMKGRNPDVFTTPNHVVIGQGS